MKQRFKGDCSLVALAMFLGRGYEELLVHYPTENEQQFSDGIWNEKTFEVSKLFGVELETRYGDEFDRSKPAIVVLDSLNNFGRKHSVYWSGDKVFDPSPQLEYTELPVKIDYVFQCAKGAHRGADEKPSAVPNMLTLPRRRIGVGL